MRPDIDHSAPRGARPTTRAAWLAALESVQGTVGADLRPLGRALYAYLMATGAGHRWRKVAPRVIDALRLAIGEVETRRAVASMPAWHERLLNVVVLNRDAFDIIPKIDDVAGTVMYVDSPYTPESRSGFSGAGAQSRYKHEFKHGDKGGLFDGDDHARLAAALGEFKHARIVVSYYDCDRVRALYDGWTFVDCTMNKAITNGSRRGGAKRGDSPEVLIINGPSFTAGGTPCP